SMAEADRSKPFGPDQIQKILQHLQQPAVFRNMTWDWPVLQWTAEHLSARLGDRLIRFRLARKEQTNGPLFETHCSYAEARLAQFLSWVQNQAGADVGPFAEYRAPEFWAYADYKYIAQLVPDLPSMFEDVRWADFGFEGRDGGESTLWIGSEGANTPCHQDAYGYNLVLQVQGRKRWHLFPPEDTRKLYPTRIPYEESSVFSRVDVLQPDLRRFPAFRGARAHVVTLQPGQVLYVPRHWWHYVESVDPVTVSVNSWIELEEDHGTRVQEAVAKAVVFALKGTTSADNSDRWLNPTEEGVTPHDQNMRYLNLAVGAFQKVRARRRERRPVKRGSGGQPREDHEGPFTVPFGPHLAPVLRPRDAVSAHQTATERLPGSGSGGCADGSLETPEVDHREPGSGTITTNDLLDCLVHPDVLARVAELLVDAHAR
uniref:Hspb associated protein 1 n=1 Tax=Tetraodon nigroviridis TaxID=99883 RepID=H3DE34_TETNG